VFELVTGDLLFLPRKGKDYSKNQDHLALIAELIGECPNKKFLISGKKSDVITFYTHNHHSIEIL
jgi:serine/threonine-protein kinase SRPK3